MCDFFVGFPGSTSIAIIRSRPSRRSEAEAGEHGVGLLVDFGLAAAGEAGGEEGDDGVFTPVPGIGDGDVVAQGLGAEEADILPGAAEALAGDKLGGEVVEGVQVGGPGARETAGSRGAVGDIVDGAAVWLQIAGENVEQGGFAGTIFAAQ